MNNWIIAAVMGGATLGITVVPADLRGDGLKAEEHKTMDYTYDIGKIENGTFNPLGTAVFVAGGAPELRLSGSDPAHSQLQAAWDETLGLEVLRIAVTEAGETASGKPIAVQVSREFGRDHADYPAAFITRLANQYGYHGVQLENAD